MNVKDSLRASLLLYPSISPNKWAVYHHWFAVNGNGLEWVNGELVDDDRKVPTIQKAIVEQCKFNFRNVGTEYFNLEFAFTYFQEAVRRILDIENREKDFTPCEELYPLCEYAKMLNIPDDIQPDWKEAVKEFYDSLIANPQISSDEDKKWLKKVKL